MKVYPVPVSGLRLLPRVMSLQRNMRRRRHRLVSPPATLCTRSWIYWPRSVALLTSRRRARGLVSRPARLSRTLRQVPKPTICPPAHPQANAMSTLTPSDIRAPPLRRDAWFGPGTAPCVGLGLFLSSDTVVLDFDDLGDEARLETFERLLPLCDGAPMEVTRNGVHVFYRSTA